MVRAASCCAPDGLCGILPQMEGGPMSKTKERIREGNLRYKQSLGQNFLYDEELLSSRKNESFGIFAKYKI